MEDSGGGGREDGGPEDWKQVVSWETVGRIISEASDFAALRICERRLGEQQDRRPAASRHRGRRTEYLRTGGFAASREKIGKISASETSSR